MTVLALANQADAQAVLDYAGRWKFDDCTTSSSVLADSSFNNTPASRGSSVGCISDGAGNPRGALSFTVVQPGNGVPATTVRAAGTSALRVTNTVSVSARIRPGLTPAGAIISKGFVASTGATEKTFQLTIERDAAGTNRLVWTVWFSSSGTSTPLSITSDVAVPASAWSQVGASYDPEDGFQVFLNGSLVGSNGTTISAPIADAPLGTASTLWLGGSATGQNQGFIGAMDDVWMSNGSCLDLSARPPSIDNELMIRQLAVVDDARAKGRGAWSFAHLMEQMVPATGNQQADRAAAATMVKTMFQTWLTSQTVHRSILSARPQIQSRVLTPWEDPVTKVIDLERAPLRLLAIVNRIDIRDLSKGQAGEGRFVFGVLNPTGTPMQFTLILEYRLPAKTTADVRQWARAFHDLGAITDSSAYNVALQAITDRFTRRGADPSRPNGSALNQLRTNELGLLSSPWELRQFQLFKDTTTNLTTLRPAAVAQTPELSFNNTDTLAHYLLINRAAVLEGRHVVGPTFLSGGVSHSPFQAGAARNSPTKWTAGVPADVRFAFALNTCSGCHSRLETDTSFTHVDPRFEGQVANLSTFLLGGGTMLNPLTGLPFNDLGRRQTDLEGVLACPTDGGAISTARVAATATKSSVTSTSTIKNLSKGINRVH